MMKDRSVLHPDRIPSYFRAEWLPLTFVTLSGLLYNVGLLAAPWFEGKLAQCLADILSGNAAAAQMAVLVLAYHCRYADGAGGALYQTVLCPPLRQQHQPPDEGHSVCRSGARKPRPRWKRKALVS